jgi:MFS transporter, DHA1 family, multidrug resistance protein
LSFRQGACFADALPVQATIVLFAVFAATVANATVFATLGLFGRGVGLGELEVGAIFAASGLLFFLTSSRWGRLSDRAGRACVMAAGLAATALSLFLFAGLYAAGGTFLGLLLARALYGLLAGGIQPAAVACMADHSPADRRTSGLALVGASVGMASIAGPMLAAAVVGFGLAVPVAIGGALAALAAGATLLGLRDGRPKAGPAALDPSAIHGLAPYLLVGFAMVLGFGALQPTTAFYVQDRFGLETEAAIRQASFASAGFAAGSFVVQAVVVRRLALAPRRLLTVGLAICLLGIAGALAASASEGLVAAFAVTGAGYGLAQSGLTAAVSIAGGPHRQGQVAGRLQAVMAAAWIAGALGGTALYAVSISAPMLLAAAAMALAFLAPTRSDSG